MVKISNGFTNTIIKVIAMICTIAIGGYMAWSVPGEELKNILTTLAQLNVTIAVGVGALSIGYVKVRKLQSKLTEITIAIIVLSLLSFAIAQIELYPLVKRIYMFLDIFFICILLGVTLKSTKKM